MNPRSHFSPLLTSDLDNHFFSSSTPKRNKKSFSLTNLSFPLLICVIPLLKIDLCSQQIKTFKRYYIWTTWTKSNSKGQIFFQNLVKIILLRLFQYFQLVDTVFFCMISIMPSLHLQNFCHECCCSFQDGSHFAVWRKKMARQRNVHVNGGKRWERFLILLG